MFFPHVTIIPGYTYILPTYTLGFRIDMQGELVTVWVESRNPKQKQYLILKIHIYLQMILIEYLIQTKVFKCMESIHNWESVCVCL